MGLLLCGSPCSPWFNALIDTDLIRIGKESDDPSAVAEKLTVLCSHARCEWSLRVKHSEQKRITLPHCMSIIIRARGMDFDLNDLRCPFQSCILCCLGSNHGSTLCFKANVGLHATIYCMLIDQ